MAEQSCSNYINKIQMLKVQILLRKQTRSAQKRNIQDKTSEQIWT